MTNEQPVQNHTWVKNSFKEEGRDFAGGPAMRLHLSMQGAGLARGQGAKIPHALQPKNQNRKKQKQYCNKSDKDFKKIK